MRRGVVCGARAGVGEVIGAAGVNSGVAMTGVDSAGGAVCAGEGLWGGVGLGGRTEGDAKTDGVDISVAVAWAVGTGLGNAGLGVARGLGDADIEGIGVEIATGVVRAVGAAVGDTGVGVARMIGAGVGDEIAAGDGVEIALALAAGVVLEVLDGTGFTRVFEGASAGGVTSAFIFARARSAAGRSVSAAQLFSTVASVSFSFTVCGRSTPMTAVIAGADMTRTSPRTLGGSVVSELTCRSRRYRSIGCRLRERISS